MRGWIVVVAWGLVGCVEADLALEAVAMAEDPLQEVRERTRVERVGEARLLPGGAPLVAQSQGWLHQRELAVVAVGERLRVVTDTGSARLLLWLDRGDLGRWVVDGGRGWARPERRDGVAGVSLPGGQEVEIVDQSGDWVAVSTSTRELELELWLPAHEVGPYWVDEPPAEAPDWRAFDAWVHSGAAILDAPHGELLAQVRPWDLGDGEGEPGVAYLGGLVHERAEGHWLVELEDEGVVVVGWVSEREVSDHSRGGVGGSGGCGGALGLGTWGVSPALVLPAGTPLYAGAELVWVGETTEERGWPVLERDPDGWTVIAVPTPWGRAEVLVW